LENSKQYRVDVLVRNHSERINALTQELEKLNTEISTEQRQRKTIESEKANILGQLTDARSDIITLRKELRSYEEDLGDLLEDFCENCVPDENHPGANFIQWGSALYPITGLEELVDKAGHCNYCSSPQIKCRECGSITSINTDFFENIECSGECGVIYRMIVVHNEYEIEVSRNGGEDEPF
ncbi:hypothetical protein JZU51_02835, partial [bacterium]|nr:hypothetical protein [bacterium]